MGLAGQLRRRSEGEVDTRRDVLSPALAEVPRGHVEASAVPF